MIERGRARRASLLGLDAHQRFARQRALTQRLRRAAWAGLTLSALHLLVAILTENSMLLVLVPIAAGLGFIMPLDNQHRWARGYLARNQGLSYETALEAEGKPDPYGLWSASTEVAVQAVRRGDSPPMDWRWLPVAVVTILMLIVSPLLVSQTAAVRDALGTLNAAANETQSTSTQTPDDPSRSTEPSGRAGEGPTPPEAAAESAPVAPQAAPEAVTDPSHSGGSETLGDEANQLGDPAAPPATGDEAIERFLAQAEQRSSSEGPSQREAESEQTGSDGPTTPNSSREAQGQDPNPEDATGAERGANEDASGEGTQIEVPSDDPAGGDARQARDEPTDDASTEGAGPSRGADTAEPSEVPDPSGVGDEREAGIEESLEGLGEGRDAGMDDRDGSEAGQSPDDRASGDGEAGNRPGSRQDSDLADGESSTTAESLNDEAPDGPRASAGVTVDRGIAPGDAPPTVSEGRPAATDARDAERIAEETNLPSVYREIIRRYFR